MAVQAMNQPSSPSAPIAPQKKGKGWLWALLALILIAAAGFGGWWYAADSAKKDKAALQSQISDLKTKSEKGSTGDRLVMSELSLSFDVSALPDLTYAMADSDTATFSSRSLMTKALQATKEEPMSMCAPGQTPLGRVSKTTGVYPAEPTIDNSSGALVKQFSGFYVSFTTPQSTCSDNVSVQQLEQDQIPLLKKIADTVQEVK